MVIDFKSNDRTQQEEVTDLQLRVYALGYEQATGERAAQVVVDNLDDLANPVTSPVNEQMLDDARSAVLTAGTELRSNRLPRRPRGTNDTARDATCSRCDLVGIAEDVGWIAALAEEGGSVPFVLSSGKAWGSRYDD